MDQFTRISRWATTGVLFCTLGATISWGQQDFRRGDADADGVVNPVADYMAIVSVLSNPQFACEDAADVNDDGVVELQDALDLLNWTFNPVFPPPALPGPVSCGPDPTPDTLTCVTYNCGPPIPLPTQANNVFRVESASAQVFEQVVTRVLLDVGSGDVAGWSFGVCHDPTQAEILSVGVGADLPLLGSYERRVVYPGEGWSVATIVQLFGNGSLPVGQDYELYLPTYEFVNNGLASLQFCDSLGSPQIPIVAADMTGNSFVPGAIPGVITGTPIPLTNDNCIDARPVLDGETFVTLTNAITDGPDLAGFCDFGPQGDDRVHQDAWFCYTAACDGDLVITASGTATNTRLAVFSDCLCPANPADVIACDDDSLGIAGGSQVTLPVLFGETYLIQLGTAAPGSPASSVTLEVTCQGPRPPGQFTEVDKITAAQPGLEDHAGFRVAIDSDVVVVGVPGDDAALPDSGAVLVYRYDGSDWTFEQKITPNVPVLFGQFGVAVDVDTDAGLIAVGSVSSGGTPFGRAYLFRFNGSNWFEEASFSESSGLPLETYSFALSVSDDLLVVGATNHGSLNSGRVYAYQDLGGGVWTDLGNVVTSDGMTFDQYGWEIDLDGDLLAVSAISGNGTGKAYAFRYDGIQWAEEDILQPMDLDPVDAFGVSIAVSNELIVVGSLLDDDACPLDPDCNSGAAYVFRFDGTNWVQEQKLTANDSGLASLFGASVAVSGDNILVCKVGLDEPQGAAYFFQYDGLQWLQTQKLFASDAESGDSLGVSSDLWGDFAVVGAWQDDVASVVDAGSAYLFNCSCTPVTSNFVRGDCNVDSSFNVADAIYLLGALFPGMSGPNLLDCLDACDGNDDGTLNIADGIALLAALFGTSTVPLPAPNSCGPDQANDSIDCSNYPTCP